MIALNDTQLVIIDIQGKLSQIVHESERVLYNSRIMIEGCRLLGIPIVWLEQLPEKLGATHPSIAEVLTGLSPIAKSCFSAYANASFVEQLESNNCKQVVLIGIETHICVYQTAVDLLRNGYEVFVVADAVSSRTSDNKAIGIETIRHEGAKILSTEAVLFALMRTAEHPKFRDIAKLVK
ncbi:MAG: hydrolase [Bacteroidota bacterium]|jgi:isochorismatase family protein